MNKLKELRKEKSLRQQDIANVLGITVSAYGNYELGQREPDLQTLKKLSEYFEVSVDYLIGNTENPYKPLEWTEEEKALGVGNHAVKLSDKEWEWIEMLSELESTCGSESLKAVETLISTFIKQNKKD